MGMIRFAAAFAASLLAASAAAAEEPPCRAHENGKAIDFWLGDWRVTSMDGATVYGENHVASDLGGCAVFEDWKSARGGRGRSLFFFDATSGEWTQIWVTANTSAPGGLKRKTLVERTEHGGARFEGEVMGAKGPYLDRTTLTPIENGEVRQHIEVSTDGGAAWRTVFDARYQRLSGGGE
jgi:hypothetical protein